MLQKYHVPWIGAPKHDIESENPILPRLHAELVDHKSERMIPKEKSPWSKARYSLEAAATHQTTQKKETKGPT